MAESDGLAARVAEARALLTALHGMRSPEERTEIRVLHGGGRAERSLFATVEEALEWGFLRSGLGDVYFGAGLRAEGRGDTAHVTRLSAAWLDLDFKGEHTAESRHRQLAGLDAGPDAVVMTGRGLQAYWWVEPVGPERFEEVRSMMKGLSRALGCDDVSDPPRILRLPGTVNLKYGDRPVARLLSLTPRPR